MNLGEFMHFGQIGVEELSITLKIFLILGNDLCNTQFSMLGTKPMLQILHIRPHWYENRGRS
jgi:hypothetical protein